MNNLVVEAIPNGYHESDCYCSVVNHVTYFNFLEEYRIAIHYRMSNETILSFSPTLWIVLLFYDPSESL